MYKFNSDLDRIIFEEEFKESGIQDINEYVLQRRRLEVGLTDLEMSRRQRENWRRYRWKYLKGIRRFHSSTKGKRFHRQLAMFLTSVPTDKIVYNYGKEREAIQKERDIAKIETTLQLVECMIALTSAFTHALIEKRYFMLLHEAVEYNLFLDEFIQVYERAIDGFKQGDYSKFDFDFMIALVYPGVWERVGLKLPMIDEDGGYLRWFLENNKSLRLLKEDEDE